MRDQRIEIGDQGGDCVFMVLLRQQELRDSEDWIAAILLSKDVGWTVNLILLTKRSKDLAGHADA